MEKRTDQIREGGEGFTASKSLPSSSSSSETSARANDITDEMKSVVMKKGPWTEEEDAVLSAYVERHGQGNWGSVQRQSGLARCGKSCRLRWTNHLRPHLKKGPLSTLEERVLFSLHRRLGNKWSRIAAQLPGRTDNEVKNFWNTRAKRLKRAGLPLYPPDLPTYESSNDSEKLKLLYDMCNLAANGESTCGKANQGASRLVDDDLEANLAGNTFINTISSPTKNALFPAAHQYPEVTRWSANTSSNYSNSMLMKSQAPYMFLLSPQHLLIDRPGLPHNQYNPCNQVPDTHINLPSSSLNDYNGPAIPTCMLGSQVIADETLITSTFHRTSNVEDHFLHKENNNTDLLDQLINYSPPYHMNDTIKDTSLGEVLDPCSAYTSHSIGPSLIPELLHHGFTQLTVQDHAIKADHSSQAELIDRRRIMQPTNAVATHWNISIPNFENINLADHSPNTSTNVPFSINTAQGD